MTRYTVIDRAGERVCTLVARDGAVDSAPDVIAYVRGKPLVEAIDLLRAAGLRLVKGGRGVTNNERVIAAALAVEGLEAGNPAHREALLALLGPLMGADGHVGAWPLDKPYGRGGASLCDAVARGILHSAGALVAEPAYVVGRGLRDLIVGAEREAPYGAWFDADTNLALRPEEGDVVSLLGPNGEPEKQHGLVGIEWNGDVLTSIDGGQVARDGLQAIYRRTRAWSVRGGHAYLGGRRVQGWIGVRLLTFAPPSRA